MKIKREYITVLLLALAIAGLSFKEITKNIMDQDKIIATKKLALEYLVKEPTLKTAKRKGIILLHGVGSNEKDLFGLAGYLPEDFYIISARGPFNLGGERFAWYNVDFSTGKPVYDARQEEISRDKILTFVRQVKLEYMLSEVYLGGFSQGAIMSYSIGLTQPQSINGVVALGGRLLSEVQPLVKKSDELKGLKVFVAHGKQDQTLGISYAKEARTYLQDLGVRLSYHEYPVGHQINASVLKDLHDWLSLE
ncbi:phospholipase [Dyadobacter endophyticus]|uniref:Phospholipase n=1 Tax=Dyadobacter endophyticus TaxID=1749036 RepID=A0ABQ1YG74_9BACT|nr:esterase [Dyadobacter endophyticus]GGH24737.1 phospholipase [Dyadobacter endophyticus]